MQDFAVWLWQSKSVYSFVIENQLKCFKQHIVIKINPEAII